MGKPLINLAWSVLTKSDLTLWETAPYARKITTSVNKADGPEYMINTLVPYGDNLLRAHRIEKLVQLVLTSSLRERLLATDSLNTYEKCNLVFPTPGKYLGPGLPSGVTVSAVYEDPQFFRDIGNGDVIYRVNVDPTAKEFTVNGGDPITYTEANNLTDSMTLAEGLTIKLKGPLGAGAFEFYINFVADPSVDWQSLLSTLAASRWTWADLELKDIAQNDPNWVNRVAAHIVSAFEENLRA